MAYDSAELTAALQLVAQGQRDALRDVYDLTSRRLFAICLRICSDRASAEDVLQEVYVSVWQKANLFDPSQGNAMAWLSTVARYRAIDRQRSRNALPIHGDGLPTDVADAGSTGEAAAEARELSGRLTDALATLDEPTRDALQRAFYEGLTYSELASSCAVPLGTMKSRIRRGLLQLRRLLDETERTGQLPPEP